MLLSCGRALFRAVAERWEAGGIKYVLGNSDESEEDSLSTDTLLAWRQALGRGAIQSRAAIEAAWVLVRSHTLTQEEVDEFSPHWGLYAETLVFLCNLAQAKGFKITLQLFERVWARALRKAKWARTKIEFQKKRAVPLSNKSVPFFFGNREIGEFDECVEEIAEGLCRAAVMLLTPGLLSVAWLLFFLPQLDTTNSPTEGGVKYCRDMLHKILFLVIPFPSLVE